MRCILDNLLCVLFLHAIIHYDKYIADFAMQFEIDSLKYLEFRSRIAYFVSKIL